jgi:hypothetical protein
MAAGVAELAGASDEPSPGMARGRRTGQWCAPRVSHIVDNGWVLVATDYTGLGTGRPHPYFVGNRTDSAAGDGQPLPVRAGNAGVHRLVVVFDKSVLSQSPSSGPLGARLRENTLTCAIDVPLLIAQGETDNLIPPLGPGGRVRRATLRSRRRPRLPPIPAGITSGLVADDSPLIPNLLR